MFTYNPRLLPIEEFTDNINTMHKSFVLTKTSETEKEVLLNRVLIFLFFCALALILQFFFTGKIFPETDSALWFYSGLFMVFFSTLFIEPYYSSPRNVITNCVPLLLILIASPGLFPGFLNQSILLGILATLIVFSFISIAINDKEKSNTSPMNVLSSRIKLLVTSIGEGKRLYSLIFLFFLIQSDLPSAHVISMVILWFVFISLNFKKIVLLPTKKSTGHGESPNIIATVFAVQSENIVMARLFADSLTPQIHDIVVFKTPTEQKSKFGQILSISSLENERWIKLLKFEEKVEDRFSLLDGQVSTFDDELINQREPLGTIVDDSEIGVVKFSLSSHTDVLAEGDLVEVSIKGKTIYYQIINAHTKIERLSEKNEKGYILVEAIQLGSWDESSLSFNKYSWLPGVGVPVYKVEAKEEIQHDFVYPDFQIGKIPNTNFPSVLNLKESINRHMALLGVTGSGKSFLARKIIKNLVNTHTVIVVDLTGEWEKVLSEKSIPFIGLHGGNLDTFLLNTNEQVGIITVPDMSNTTEVLTQTQKSIERIFNFAKEKYQKGETCEIALVLEEAHTITPELSFLGDLGDYGANKALVNKMCQVALQGRKYGVGLMVLAQRTANVSKTVLTQCQTLICFQAFDETSFTFLGNHVGKSLVRSLPNMPEYHALVLGKGARSNLPMIVDLTDTK